MSDMNPILSFKISPEKNALDGITLKERISKETLQKLINSNLLKLTITNPISKVYYANEKLQLETYLKKWNDGYVPVLYQRHPKNPYGRSNPLKALGLFPFRSEIRHTLAETMVDLDVHNCHPEMLRQLCLAENFPHQPLTDYCANRQKYYDEGVAAYGCSEKEIKELYIRFLYGGSFEGWAVKLNKTKCHPMVIPRGTILELEHMNAYRTCMIPIQQVIVAANPHLLGIVKKLKLEKEKNFYNINGSVCSFVLQEYEIRILEVMYDYCQDSGLIRDDVATLCADGLMIEKEFYTPDLLEDFQHTTKEFIGFDLTFTEKPMLKGYQKELGAILLPPEKKSEKEKFEDTSIAEFARISAIFEKTHTKIIDKSVFIKTKHDSFQVFSKRDLIISYEHMQCGTNAQGHPVSFIHKWVGCNDNINQKLSMEFYPNASLCPNDVFNLWTPFAMEVLTKPYKKDDEGLNFILKHFRIMCNNEEESYQYFLKWVAYLFQFPERKSSCIVLIGDEGAGKTSIFHFFKKVMGAKKVFETRDPERDVWGNFNSMMIDAFLVCLNELEYKETMAAEGKIKGLITEPSMTINQKGLAQFEITSYHKFIITTNKENPIKTQKGDRRKFIMRTSDELILNVIHFNELYGLYDNLNTMRTCYDYFLHLDITDFNCEVMPKTEYQEDLKELSKSPVELWLGSFTWENQHNTIINLTGQKTYELFREWCVETNTSFDTNPAKLGMKLTNLKIQGITKGEHKALGSTKNFDITLLKQYYNI